MTENLSDKAIHLSSAGTRNGRAKLTDAQVRDVRREYASIKKKPPRTARADLLGLCDRYGISESNADMIGRRITWKHVRDEE
jgi:hypothetical protein